MLTALRNHITWY